MMVDSDELDTLGKEDGALVGVTLGLLPELLITSGSVNRRFDTEEPLPPGRLNLGAVHKVIRSVVLASVVLDSETNLRAIKIDFEAVQLQVGFPVPVQSAFVISVRRGRWPDVRIPGEVGEAKFDHFGQQRLGFGYGHKNGLPEPGFAPDID